METFENSLASAQQHSRHGSARTKVHRAWAGMKNRCKNPEKTCYEGKGIKVCDRWEHFTNFLEDMGEPPSELHSIERKNNLGNYEPSNCHWALPKEQMNNTSYCLKIEWKGESHTLRQWCEKLELNYNTTYTRLRRGYSLDWVFSKDSMRFLTGRRNNIKQAFQGDYQQEDYQHTKEIGEKNAGITTL